MKIKKFKEFSKINESLGSWPSGFADVRAHAVYVIDEIKNRIPNDIRFELDDSTRPGYESDVSINFYYANMRNLLAHYDAEIGRLVFTERVGTIKEGKRIFEAEEDGVRLLTDQEVVERLVEGLTFLSENYPLSAADCKQIKKRLWRHYGANW